MPESQAIEVSQRDFESLGLKLERLHKELTDKERAVFEMIASSVGAQLAEDKISHPREMSIVWTDPSKPPKKIHGGGHGPAGGRLIIGGNDGLTIIFKASGRIIVVPPMGPGPVPLKQ